MKKSLTKPRTPKQPRRLGKPVRLRRTAKDARQQILEAAERRLINGGPEAIRLQDIAADVGISHPVISHHFGSREGLMEALTQHASDRLQEAIIRVLVTRRVGDPTQDRIDRIAHMLELGFKEIAEQGYARLWAWLALSGRDLRDPVQGMFSGLAQVIHSFRVQWSLEDGRPAPDIEDTQFGIILGITTLVGEALCGPYAQLTVGLPEDEETGRRFRRWLAQLFQADRPLPPQVTSAKNRHRRAPRT